MAKKVAVIGAGVSGLVTVKELLAAGHEPVCLEKAQSLGGVFRFDETDGVVWESCRLTSSGHLTAFSDFPVSPDRSEHMHISEYIRYLEEYCEAFDLLDHVRFNRPVQSVVREVSGHWTVVFGPGSATTKESFDAVVVCSGLHQHPHLPDFPGQSEFEGEILHAAQYRRPSQIENKTVLVVGAGESGADIAAEVAGHARRAVLSLRRGVAVVPRCAGGYPRDYRTTRLANAAAHWIGQTRNPEDNQKRTVYRVLGFPVLLVERSLQLFHRFAWEILPTFLSTRRGETGKKRRTRQLADRLLRESGGTLFEQFGTKDIRFVEALADGSLERVQGISRFEKFTVHFEDGSSVKPDVVVFCTGFETRMPFLGPELADAPRYLNTFNPDVGETLGFVGFVRPAFGAIPPLAELQARWIARLLNEEVQLPPVDTMKQSIKDWYDYRRHVFRAKEDRLAHLVDHAEYCDLLARQVGCMPGTQDLARESHAFRQRYFAGPFIAAQYRLVGPDARPGLARRVIESMPIAHPWPQRTHLRIRWWVSRLLHRWFGAEYCPKLSVD